MSRLCDSRFPNYVISCLYFEKADPVLETPIWVLFLVLTGRFTLQCLCLFLYVPVSLQLLDCCKVAPVHTELEPCWPPPLGLPNHLPAFHFCQLTRRTVAVEIFSCLIRCHHVLNRRCLGSSRKRQSLYHFLHSISKSHLIFER